MPSDILHSQLVGKGAKYTKPDRKRQGELYMDSTYRIEDINQTSIKVLNEEGDAEWYPSECFQVVWQNL